MDKRIFLAVKIDPEPELLDLVDLLQEELAEERIKWVSEKQFHITLKFFGDKTESQVRNISEAIKKSCSENEDFSFNLGNPWYFRDRTQLRVVLLKASKTEKLIAFQKELENEFTKIGLVKEDRVFKPHLTLGRVKSIYNSRHFYEFMKQFPQKVLQTVWVKEIVLFESILKPQGPEYLVLETFKLGENFLTSS